MGNSIALTPQQREEALLVWQELLDGLRRQVPYRFWSLPFGDARAELLVGEMIKRVSLDRSQLKRGRSRFFHQLFSQWKLSTVLVHVYQDSLYLAFKPHFPDLERWEIEECPWESSEGPRLAWLAVRWFLDKEGIHTKEQAARVSWMDFRRAGLGGMLQHAYHNSPYAALSEHFPDLLPWDMKRVPLNAWADEAGRQLAQQAVADFLATRGITTKKQASRVTKRDFEAAGLGGMLVLLYHSCPYEALHPHFPDLQPWEMQRAPRGCWMGEEGRQRAEQVIAQFLSEQGITREQAVRLRQKDFPPEARHALADVYRNSPYEALLPHFPDLHPWEMSKVPQGYWKGPDGREHAREAIRWLLERVGGHPSYQDFCSHGLGPMLHIVYRGSVQKALSDLIDADVLIS